MGELASVGMGNVLEKAKQEQVIALGRLGWSLRRIEAATGVRRETAWRLLEVGRDSIAFSRRLGAQVSSKSGHFGDHRLGQFKTGHRGDHRLFAGREVA